MEQQRHSGFRLAVSDKEQLEYIELLCEEIFIELTEGDAETDGGENMRLKELREEARRRARQLDEDDEE